ncbi:hypothetical protein OF83DRAFT_1055552 [Amylostereum chailletii]|nr:hypothetical protein OF83DRAFT_1055552 [Amylostereum chailletii]
MAQCDGIQPNPDISGIGIRVNFYATTLLIAMIPKTAATEPLLETLFTNAGLSGLALLISTIIQTAKGNLDLYHAIYIQHLLFFLGIGIFPAAKYSWGTFRLVMTSLFRLATYIMYLVWSLYVWTHASSFGAQPECNDEVKYVVFVSVRATAKWLSKLWIAALAVSAGLLTLWVVGRVGVVLYKRFYVREEDAYRDEDDEGEGRTWGNLMYTLVLLLSVLSLSWLVRTLMGARAGRISVYSVVMLQLMVRFLA